MDYLQLPEIVNQSFSKADLNKLVPQKGDVWIDQFKALLSAVPFAGDFLIVFGFKTPIIVEFDGLKIGLPTAMDEDIDKMIENFKLPEKERQSIIDISNP